MTVKMYPIDGKALPDAGAYSSTQWALVWQSMMSNYERRTTAGVYYGTGNGTKEALLVEQTSPTSLGVVVRRGAAMVNGYNVINDDDETLSINQNTDPTDDRIDTIAAEINLTNGDGNLVVVEGTADPAPTAPSLTQSTTIWQIRIADITVVHLDTEIVDGDIDNTVREFATRWDVREGGTGLTSVASADILYASAANVLSALNLAPYFAPVGVTSAPVLALPYSGAILLYDTSFGTDGLSVSSNTWTTIPWNNLDDPAGMFSNSGGDLTVQETGTYELVMGGIWRWQSYSGGSNYTPRVSARVYNDDQAVEYPCLSSEEDAIVTAATLFTKQMLPVQFDASQGEVIKIQGYLTGTSALFGLATSAVINSNNENERPAWAYIRRIK